MMIGTSPRSVILYWMEFSCPQFEHALVGVKWLAARRSLVGTISCIATYHFEVREADRTQECRFFHARSQSISGHFLTNCNLRGSTPLLVLWSKLSYMRRLNDFSRFIYLMCRCVSHIYGILLYIKLMYAIPLCNITKA